MELKVFLIAFILFIIADALFLGLVMQKVWKRELQASMRNNITLKSMLIPALLVYLLLALGLAFFVLPQIQNSSYIQVFGIGALFGLIVYGVFDFTNLIIIENYTVKLALIDICWGSFISGAITLITRVVN